MKYRYLDTPIGNVLLAGDESGLRFVGFPEGKGKVQPNVDWTHDESALVEAAVQLNEYFAGERTTFDLKLSPTGTPFQLAVLAALQDIPYGETRTYSDIAQVVGNPAAVRAVGAANGRNPLPIVIPCHRVIGANGSLTGFGGGIDTKRYLLALETSELPMAN